MSNYRYLFLPIDLPIEEGCTVIDSAGDEFIYDSSRHHYMNTDNIRRAEPFIVEYMFNTINVIGRPSDSARAWLKNRDEVSRGLVEPWERLEYRTELPILKIHCPTCRKLH